MACLRRMTGLVKWFVFGIVLTVKTVSWAQSERDPIQTRVFRDEQGEHRYGLFLPKGYSPEKKWPVILFLHGAGERGSDGVIQTRVGIGPVLRKRADSFPFIVVLPQCEDVSSRYLTGWLHQTADAQRALKILDEVEKQYAVDPSRRVLTGWSMGGYGTWSLAAADPKRWSAIVPLAGGGDDKWGASLSELPTWAFHGSNDAAIRPDQSRAIIAAVRSAGGSPRYTEVTDGDHDIGELVYDSEPLINWMQSPKTTEPVNVVLRAPTAKQSKDPFIPAAELSRAITLRLGNDMLEALSMSLHEMVPPDALRGSINDIYDATVVEGRRFDITFGSISYGAQVTRVRLKAYREQRVNVQIGIKDAVMRIGGTSVVGRDHSASTGPIDVVIGHREPVWLSIDVAPYIEQGRLRLKTAGASFEIPFDNWYVTAPAGVSVQGFGITREKVSNGLVNGLYSSKARIENEVLAVVPKLVTELENKLDLIEADQVINSFWPLPVYKPRVRVRAEEIAVDPNGVSVVLGAQVAALDPAKPPKSVTKAAVTDLTVASLPKDTSLSLGIAPHMLSEMTRMMVEANVARIHVLDIPEPSFAKFADESAMTEVFPDLKRHGTGLILWSELSLAEPISIGPSRQDSDMRFNVPGLKIAVSYKTQANAPKFERLADIVVQLSQDAAPGLTRPDYESRMFQLNWVGKAEMKITAQYDASYKAEQKDINLDRLTELLRASWSGWIGKGAAAQTPIPDLDFGISTLRLNSVNWKHPLLSVVFTPPGVKLTNSFTEPLEYQTRGPFSGWSGSFTLAPGKSHEYPISYPLTYRQRVGDEYVEYTLSPGSHSEYRLPKAGGKPTLFKAREELRSQEPAL